MLGRLSGGAIEHAPVKISAQANRVASRDASERPTGLPVLCSPPPPRALVRARLGLVWSGSRLMQQRGLAHNRRSRGFSRSRLAVEGA
jgi:hypothetical protein